MSTKLMAPVTFGILLALAIAVAIPALGYYLHLRMEAKRVAALDQTAATAVKKTGET